MLYGIRATTADPVSFNWVDTDFLFEHGVRPWADMPAWLPPRDGYEGYGSISRDRAIAAGLRFRPLAVTASETFAWWLSLPEERRENPKAGLTPEREAEVLAAWKEVNSKK
jgi:2'-hydroxyisoflavone reductase